MSKSVELTSSQIKAFENGATMFIFPTDLYRIESEYDESIFPLQKGNKDVWIKEEFSIGVNEDMIVYKHEEFKNNTILSVTIKNWKPASQMTKEQSRYSFKEVLDVRVVRVQDVNWNEITNIMKIVCTCKDNKDNRCYGGGHDGHFKQHYNQQMQELNINRTYEDNDYVFLIEIKSN